jgi:hypothetical protein
MQAVQTEKPSTWLETLAGMLAFLQFPLIYGLGMFIFPQYPDDSWLIALARAMVFLSTWFIILLLGFAIGWWKGFPRWCYPYVASSILGSFYLANASTPGMNLFGFQVFGREVWGPRACIPALLMIGIMLLVTRSFKSLAPLFTNAWEDWTRVTFALFGQMPLINFIVFDEVPDRYTTPFQVALVIITMLAAAAYLRSTSTIGRVLSLFAGFGLCVAIDAIAPTLYWLDHGGADIASMVTFAIFFMVIVFLPAIIGLARHLSSPRLESSS